MEKRRHQTAADFAAIALCPSLIVLLIASLVYFLVMCVYRGGYSGRIGYIWFMFIVGAVGIARLSIQESRKYAMAYAGVLGLATFVVLSRFMTVQGPLAGMTPVINGATIALVWFLADRITFDCTLIDEDQDASGRGLLDGLTDSGPSDDDAKQHATRKRGRQPGRTVLWLTAAALPIFGFGQMMLPADERWQRSAMFALAIYLFAALSLLVATSFLGVRRYLRQRGVDMPANVTGAWLIGGVAMTAIMLLVCFLLPQPGKMLANAELPQTLQSPDWLKPSKYGWGSESASPKGSNGDEDNATTPAQSADQETSQSGGPDSKSEKSSGEAGGQKPGEKGEGGEKSGGTKKSEGEQNGQSGGDDKSQGKASESEKSDNAKTSDRNTEQNSKDDQAAGQSKDQAKQAGEKQSDAPEQEASESNDQANESPSQTPPPPEPLSARTRPSKPLELPSLSSLGTVLKVIIYLILFGILLFFAWTQRHEIAKAWQAFLAWLRGEAPAEEVADAFNETEQTAKTNVPFSAFRNPLQNSADPRQAIIVTYQAAEAWWREHGQARNPDETPFEFVRRLKRSSQNDHDAMIRLTEAYNRIVYGNDSAKQPDIDAAAAVWKSFSRPV